MLKLRPRRLGLIAALGVLGAPLRAPSGLGFWTITQTSVRRPLRPAVNVCARAWLDRKP